MPPWWLVAIAGIGAYKLGRKALGAIGIGSWSAHAGVTMNSRLESFMDRLSASVPAAMLPLIVNNGVRTAADQARIMLANIASGNKDDEETRALYGNTAPINSLLTIPPERRAAVWPGMIQAQINAGIFLSGHMRGGGVDLHIKHYSDEQVETLIACAKTAGARQAFTEDKGQSNYHLHVTVF